MFVLRINIKKYETNKINGMAFCLQRVLKMNDGVEKMNERYKINWFWAILNLNFTQFIFIIVLFM